MTSVLTPSFLGAAQPHRNVGVAAEAAFLHVAVGHLEITQHRPQFAQISSGLFGGAEVGLADDFHQGYARAVEIDQAAIGRVDVLAGVFLQVDADQADAGRAAVAGLTGQIDVAAQAQWSLVLAYLVALGQVRIEVVFAVEDRPRRDFAMRRQAHPNRQLQHPGVEHRQHPRHPGAYRAHMGVGRGAERGRASAENLGLGQELAMHLQPDYCLVFFVDGGHFDHPQRCAMLHLGRPPRKSARPFVSVARTQDRFLAECGSD